MNSLSFIVLLMNQYVCVDGVLPQRLADRLEHQMIAHPKTFLKAIQIVEKQIAAANNSCTKMLSEQHEGTPVNNLMGEVAVDGDYGDSVSRSVVCKYRKDSDKKDLRTFFLWVCYHDF